MTARFHPQLINEPFGDPGVYIDFMFEKRAILFDLGDLANMPARKLLRVTDVFVSHMHIDHFCGFDRLLRLMLGRSHVLRLHGPHGLINAVQAKLAAYTWNLVHRYKAVLTLTVAEQLTDNRLRLVDLRSCDAFRPTHERIRELNDDCVYKDAGFSVRARQVHHGTTCLAFALEENAHVNILKNRLETLGLRVGPWLKDFKTAVLRGAPDATTIRAEWQEGGRVKSRELPLGDIRNEIATVTAGYKIAYIVDCAPTDRNLQQAAALAERASVLFAEAAFLRDDEDRAHDRLHLTAWLAGTIARAADAERLVTFHYSPRYTGRAAEIVSEAEAAFRCDGSDTLFTVNDQRR